MCVCVYVDDADVFLKLMLMPVLTLHLSHIYLLTYGYTHLESRHHDNSTRIPDSPPPLPQPQKAAYVSDE